MATKAQMQVVMDELDSEIIDLKASEADWKRRYERAVDRSINPVMMESDMMQWTTSTSTCRINSMVVDSLQKCFRRSCR